MAKGNPNKLMVEGDEEKRVIPYLMDKYVAWGDSRDRMARSDQRVWWH